MAVAEFWYEFASTYSYPAAMRVARSRSARREPRLAALPARPDFRRERLAGFAVQYLPRRRAATCGATWSAICDALGLPLKRPDPFPRTACSPRASRSRSRREARAISRAEVYAAEFGDGLPIADRATIAALLAKLGLDPEAAFARAENDANKARLKAESARAAELGVIGAPCLVTEDSEVFWGNDRLEQGLDWAAGARA